MLTEVEIQAIRTELPEIQKRLNAAEYQSVHSYSADKLRAEALARILKFYEAGR